MKNSEIAASLMALANVYGTTPDATAIATPQMSIYATSKDEVIAAIRAIGGKFTKRVNDDYFMYYDSVRIPGAYVFVNRSVVCRKIPARYECEPLLSPEDEAEILVEA